MLWALPGFFGQGADYDFLRAAYPRNTFLRSIDLWQSKYTALSLADFGRFYSEEIGRQDLNPFLIGYSLGGRLALHSLLSNKTMIRGAILISAHFGERDVVIKNERYARDSVWAERVLRDPWPQLQKDWNQQSVFDSAATLERVESDYERPQLAAAMRHWSLGRQDFLLPRLAALRLPLTLIVGEKDERYCQQAELAAAQNSLIQVVVVPGAGHRLLHEAPHVIVAELRKLCLF